MMTRMTISVVVEMCSVGNSFCYLASKLLYEAATKIGKRENARTRNVEPDHATSAPAFMIMAP